MRGRTSYVFLLCSHRNLCRASNSQRAAFFAWLIESCPGGLGICSQVFSRFYSCSWWEKHSGTSYSVTAKSRSLVSLKNVFDQIRRCTYLGQDSLRPAHKKYWSFVLNGDFRDYAVSWKQKFWLSRSGETSLNNCGDSFVTQKIRALALESRVEG